jgi:hypothetical protein
MLPTHSLLSNSFDKLANIVPLIPNQYLTLHDARYSITGAWRQCTWCFIWKGHVHLQEVWINITVSWILLSSQKKTLRISRIQLMRVQLSFLLVFWRSVLLRNIVKLFIMNIYTIISSSKWTSDMCTAYSGLRLDVFNYLHIRLRQEFWMEEGV